MVFENLSNKLQDTFKRLRGMGKLSEKNIEESLREVRLALLEADVNFKVVKDFIATVKERSIGQEVLNSLTPGQQVIKIVYEELTKLMGEHEAPLKLADRPPTIVMLVGLQGAGKTSTAGKMAGLLKKQGRRPLLIAADIYRPAAIKQLQVLGGQLDIPVFSLEGADPVKIARQGVEYAIAYQRDLVIIDTAGRLHVNEELMNELKEIQARVNPHEILLVIDAMTGQDAVNVANSFQETLGLTGVILTKLDSDTRGGAALSVRAVTKAPIKYVGLGEKMENLEVFHPSRMASRVLGMGDVLTLIEKAQSNIDPGKAKNIFDKMRKAEFTLDDFLDQLREMKKMGPLDQILGMLPGNMSKQLKGVQVNEKEMVKVEAIIQSMTKQERANPSIINGSRRRRIAVGSGTTVQDVNRILQQFEQSRKMMKQFADMGGKGKMPKLPF
ncbi:signal recognition particle subunit FFH/SRP54 (srp54) [Hydrogenispora ethanolica]|uniref:Signal recognition particle protein n=1 Tax=Hydrogenispora ethanolica TaxID=1082276 RepID=A0A4R1QUU2_HYDET|nr:signal recognition particle protein [Hydrogenispora ethanolica]TCL53920.1 signal recognition particle subunit FFH/SRP54 (srp54) [Hydrogenispora ethanolica]